MPHYDRHARSYERSTPTRSESIFDDDTDPMDDAAQALRAAELESVQAAPPVTPAAQLESMSIDELRKLAAKLDVPNRGAITEQDQLISAIRARM